MALTRLGNIAIPRMSYGTFSAKPTIVPAGSVEITGTRNHIVYDDSIVHVVYDDAGRNHVVYDDLITHTVRSN